jgi:hypothetical protein
MNDRFQLRLLRFQKELKRNSWENFQEILRLACSSHGTDPNHVRALGLLRNRDWTGLVNHADSISRQSYPTASEHFEANQLALIIKKYSFPKGVCSFDPELEAVTTFKKAEAQCLASNVRFRGFRTWSPFESLLSQCRSFILYCIGHRPDLEEIYDNSSFGPGASLGVHGNATNVSRKIGGVWTVTPSAYHYARSAAKRNSQLFELLTRQTRERFYTVDPLVFNDEWEKRAEVVNHNKIAFVPKTVKTLRSIAVEPLWNGFIQKGIDLCLRRKLLRCGIDLSDQSLNQEMARLGSLGSTGEDFVTIDLSSASDSISIELCRHLLPVEWFDFLNATRSKSFLLNGEFFTYEKFCSMGNGFCFPLETLLFTSACVAVGGGVPGRDFHVYGDDIVIRKKHAVELLTLLGVMGFTVNSSKTFLDGPFRESCGDDRFEGKDVRPFTLDFELDSLSSLFKFLNLSRRNSFSTSYFMDVAPFVRSLIPPDLAFVRPFPGPADSAIECEMDEFMSSPFSRYLPDTWSWGWRELLSKTRSDPGWKELWGSDISLLWTGLSGGNSSQPFALRRSTRTRVRFISHSGGSSNWIPGHTL